VVALGIDIDGIKHPLSLVEGSTENTTLVTELIVGLRERGLDVTRPILVVLDGSKALRRAMLDVFDRPVLGRCQLHKIRNVADHLPEKLRTVVTSRPRRAYHADSVLAAEAELGVLAAELDRTHPRCRRQSARGHGRDPDGAAAEHATHPGAHVPLDERESGTDRGPRTCPRRATRPAAPGTARRPKRRTGGRCSWHGWCSAPGRPRPQRPATGWRWSAGTLGRSRRPSGCTGTRWP
jgi:hypothetical protein